MIGDPFPNFGSPYYQAPSGPMAAGDPARQRELEAYRVWQQQQAAKAAEEKRKRDQAAFDAIGPNILNSGGTLGQVAHVDRVPGPNGESQSGRESWQIGLDPVTGVLGQVGPRTWQGDSPSALSPADQLIKEATPTLAAGPSPSLPGLHDPTRSFFSNPSTAGTLGLQSAPGSGGNMWLSPQLLARLEQQRTQRYGGMGGNIMGNMRGF